MNSSSRQFLEHLAYKEEESGWQLVGIEVMAVPGRNGLGGHCWRHRGRACGKNGDDVPLTPSEVAATRFCHGHCVVNPTLWRPLVHVYIHQMGGDGWPK